ncbi:MFS transporter, partial [Nocardia farcinica]|uniref:MFS transporter n=1 Tax=Nocardia farcinica TaxID=37329 RepID=UPI002453CDEB
MTNDLASGVQLPVPDERERARVQRRTLTVVVVSQVLGGAGLAAGITVGALLAQQMLGSGSAAGVPTALFTLGSALAAFSIGRFTQRWGRRIGLGLGFGAGALGAVGVVVAAVIDSAPLLFVALFVYGAGTATNLQARYAGTDLASPDGRGRAVSVALVSTTLGAVAGPNLVEPLGRTAEHWGIPPLAGPFLLAAVAYAAAGIALLTLLRPDPYLLARAITTAERIAAGPAAAGSGGPPARGGGAGGGGAGGGGGRGVWFDKTQGGGQVEYGP